MIWPAVLNFIAARQQIGESPAEEPAAEEGFRGVCSDGDEGYHPIRQGNGAVDETPAGQGNQRIGIPPVTQAEVQIAGTCCLHGCEVRILEIYMAQECISQAARRYAGAPGGRQTEGGGQVAPGRKGGNLHRRLRPCDPRRYSGIRGVFTGPADKVDCLLPGRLHHVHHTCSIGQRARVTCISCSSRPMADKV